MILPHRERNGRRQRLPSLERRMVDFVASQPHRRGERTNIAATPLQRLVKAGLVSDPTGRFTQGQLEDAALRYCEARLNFLKAIGAPMPFAAGKPGQDRDLSPELRARWVATWSKILFVVRKAGKWRAKALAEVTEAHPEVDERQFSWQTAIAVSEALRALAGHFTRRNS
jgi:hypothetical protein